MSPLTGLRDDAWSGSVAARKRLLIAVVDAVRANWPAAKPLLVRRSIDDVAPGGSTAADSADVSARLAERGVDLIDCSSGGLMPGIDYAAAPGYQGPGSRTVRASGVPTAAVGITTEAA
ncbi:hypothetical protein HQQ80_15600 [Microbacteriaceae bacterium VKM Ac-2855]|nr:hypothetical protein [Microbacteriaceae bacterium VKM Ac-2855]